MSTTDAHSHLTESVLFECSADGDWSEEVRERAASCAECARVLADFNEAAAQARNLLRAADAPQPIVDAHAVRFQRLTFSVPGRRHMKYGPIAAVFALGFLAAMFVAPVRAWVLNSWRSIVTSETIVEDEGAPEDMSRVPAATLAFVPSGSELTVVFDHWQVDGVLNMETGSGSEASLRILGESPVDNVLVTGSGVRIRNEPESHTSYSMVVPLAVRIVRVSVGGQLDNTFPISQLIDGPIDVSLQQH